MGARMKHRERYAVTEITLSEACKPMAKERRPPLGPTLSVNE